MADQLQNAGCGAREASRSGKTAEPLLTFPPIGGRIPAPPPMPTGGGVFRSSDPAPRYEDAVQGGQEDVEPNETDDEEYESDDEEDDNDGEFEEDGWPAAEVGDGEAGGKQDPALDFVEFLHQQQARFEFVENTAGFMRVVAAEAGQDDSESEIVVHYRYTLFSSSPNGGVAVRRGPRLQSLRFLVPSPSTDTASSLRLAGALLAHVVYPDHARNQLRALWSSLLAAAARAPATLPPRAARLDVTVDAGVLRPRGDSSPARAARMLTALPAVAWKVDAWLARHDDGSGVVVLSLPALVRVDDEESDGDVRPAKRRRLAAAGEEEEECAICFEAMEETKGLAAWPQCSHVFHGGCVEELLVRGDHRCPLCRTELRLEVSG